MNVFVISAVRESTSQSILLDPLYFLVFEKKVFLLSLYIFRGYENDVLFYSFLYFYLENKHWVLKTLEIILQSYMFCIPWLELVLYKIL